jgi:hypothetical protein
MVIPSCPRISPLANPRSVDRRHGLSWGTRLCIEKSNIDNETRNRIREEFLQKMGGNPLADVLAETASTFNFNEEEEDVAPSVLDNLPNFMNKDYSQTLKAMEISEKSRRTNM